MVFIYCRSGLHLLQEHYMCAREGVIIKCPLNGQFNDACDVILTSRNDVRGFAGDDDDALRCCALHTLFKISFFVFFSRFWYKNDEKWGKMNLLCVILKCWSTQIFNNFCSKILQKQAKNGKKQILTSIWSAHHLFFF